MKKFLVIAVFAGVAFASCVKNEVAVLPEASQEISFEVAKYLPSSSRAEVDFPTSQTFGTYAFYENSGAPGTHTVFMDNVEIMYKVVSGNSIWASKSGQYFWPTQGHLDFVSYAPYNADAANAAVPKFSDSEQTLKFEGFKVVEAVAPALPVDLMYSNKAMSQTSNTFNYGFTGVPTLFHHALAKLNFMVKAVRLDNKDSIAPGEKETKWVTTINSIKIEGIYDTGNLTLTLANDHTAPKVLEWTNSNALNVWNTSTSTTSKEWAQNHELTTAAVVYGQGTSTVAKDYYVMPQQLIDNQQKITINYTIVTTAPNGQVGTKSYEKVDYFNRYTAVDNWELGKNIIYTIEIDPFGDEIHFAPKVIDWEDVNGVINF